MTLNNLLLYLEQIYNERYSGIFRDTMTSYLAGFSEGFYQAAAKILVKRFSRTYNRAPGPAEFEKNMAEIINAIPFPPALPEPKMTDDEKLETLQFLNALKKSLKEKWRQKV